MTFFLIVPSVMIVGVFLVHGVFNRLGLRMHFGALILCAVLSVAADVGAAMLSTAPDKNYFINLGGLIFGAALIATSTNYFLVRRKKKSTRKLARLTLRTWRKELSGLKKLKPLKKFPSPSKLNARKSIW